MRHIGQYFCFRYEENDVPARSFNRVNGIVVVRSHVIIFKEVGGLAQKLVCFCFSLRMDVIIDR